MKTIRTRREFAGQGWQAALGDDFKQWERADTESEAIGRLVMSHATALGIRFVSNERRTATVAGLLIGDSLWHAVRWQKIARLERSLDGLVIIHFEGGETVTWEASMKLEFNMVMEQIEEPLPPSFPQPLDTPGAR